MDHTLLTVHLTYFKSNGKFYASGSYKTEYKELYKIFQDVKQMLETKTLPGLNEGHDFFIVLVTVPYHPHNYPQLLGLS